jgi:hypothetical protein
MLSSHLDVVAAGRDPADWEHPPFEAAVAGGYLSTAAGRWTSRVRSRSRPTPPRPSGARFGRRDRRAHGARGAGAGSACSSCSSPTGAAGRGRDRRVHPRRHLHRPPRAREIEVVIHGLAGPRERAGAARSTRSRSCPPCSRDAGSCAAISPRTPCGQRDGHADERGDASRDRNVIPTGSRSRSTGASSPERTRSRCWRACAR